jgi:hypothetical protein
VFVQRSNRVSGELGEAQHARDLGTAVAAGADHFPRAAALVHGEGRGPRHAGERSRLGDRVSQGKRGAGQRLRPVCQLVPALELAVVGAEKTAQPRRVAGAPEVFEE